MKNYKLIKDNEVINTIVIDDAETLAYFQSQYDAVEEVVVEQPVIAPTPVAVTVTPIQFKQLFTSAERIAIKNARPTDEIIDDFMTIVDDPNLTAIDLSRASTVEFLDYLVSSSIITAERKDAIKSGVVV